MTDGVILGAPASDEEDTPSAFHASTIDKLGVRLYERVSALVAELVANGYDADADDVWVELPLSTVLAPKDADTGESIDRNYEIVVRDDGHGMTSKEARAFYIQVGRDRRRRRRVFA